MYIKIKECKYCKLSIPEGSSKCSHCGSYQSNFWQKLSKVSPLVSTVIATSAFVISIYPTVADVIFDKYAKVEIEILDARDGVLEIYVQNTGNKNAVLGNVEVSYEVDAGSTTEAKNFTLELSEVVKAQEETLLRTSSNNLLLDMTKSKNGNQPYSPNEYKSSLNDRGNRPAIFNCRVQFSYKSSNTVIEPEMVDYKCTM